MASPNPSQAPSTSRLAIWTTASLDEIGIIPLWRSSINVKLLCLQRIVRQANYGASTIILVPFLRILGSFDTQIGLFMTMTMAGDVLISLLLTLVADRLGRRKILTLGALMMAGSGVVFALTENYWILLAAAIFGVITPSGNEIGPFRAIEESTLAQLTEPEERASIFAWYTLLGQAGGALGLIGGGWVTTLLIEQKAWMPLHAYRVIFLVYAVLGGVKLVLSLLLSKNCEIQNRPPQGGALETAPLLLANEDNSKRINGHNRSALLPTLSRESKVILLQLCLLLALDNFSSGLVSLTWITSYFHRRFGLSSGQIGSIFFTTSLIAAVSVLFSASLARRIGNVKAMAFTHLPSSICLAFIGLPSTAGPAIALLVLRACTQSMDTAPRTAFTSEVVLPEERTHVMGIINVVKTLCQGLGPLATGFAAERGLFWLAFPVAGCMKVAYDMGFLLLFASHKPREKEPNEHEGDEDDRS